MDVDYLESQPAYPAKWIARRNIFCRELGGAVLYRKLSATEQERSRSLAVLISFGTFGIVRK